MTIFVVYVEVSFFLLNESRLFMDFSTRSQSSFAASDKDHIGALILSNFAQTSTLTAWAHVLPFFLILSPLVRSTSWREKVSSRSCAFEGELPGTKFNNNSAQSGNQM